MSGLDEGRLLAYLDGELEGDDRAEVAAWLDASDEARAALAEVERRRSVVARAVASLETPAPDVEAARARVMRRGSAARPGWWSRARLAQAAVLVLLLGAAGVSAAVPGSPLGAWLRSVFTDTPAAPAGAAPEGVVPEAEAEGPTDEMGLRVRPAAGVLDVALSGVPADREVVVVLVDSDHGAVYAGRATFRSGAGRIEAAVDAAGAGPVRVEIPRSVASATLRVDGRVWLRKRGERLDFPGPTARVSSDTMRFGGGG
jgi:hypothetical protein